MANRWGDSGNSVRFYFWGVPKSLQMVTAAMKLKDACSLEEKLWPTWWRFSRSVVSDSCDPMDCSLPGSSGQGIFQARILEWVAISFSSCHQSFPASGSFPMNHLFTSGGQSIEASALPSVPPMNIQSWFPLGLTSLISLESKRLSRVFSSTTIQKHQFFGAQPSLWSNSHMPFSISSVQFSRSVVSDSLWPHELQR